MKERRKRLL